VSVGHAQCSISPSAQRPVRSTAKKVHVDRILPPPWGLHGAIWRCDLRPCQAAPALIEAPLQRTESVPGPTQGDAARRPWLISVSNL
jgi:hypothetical protein